MDHTPQNDQLSEFERLRAHLLHLHDEMGMTWLEISLLEEYRRIQAHPSSLHAMAVYGREPKDPVRRELYGLPPLSGCGQCWQVEKYLPAIIKRFEKHKARELIDYSQQTLGIMIKYREKV